MLYAARVHAGFPSPADDFIDKALDLNEHLIAHPAATFFVKVQGDSMIGAGILLNISRYAEGNTNSIHRRGLRGTHSAQPRYRVHA